MKKQPSAFPVLLAKGGPGQEDDVRLPWRWKEGQLGYQDPSKAAVLP